MGQRRSHRGDLTTESAAGPGWSRCSSPRLLAWPDGRSAVRDLADAPLCGDRLGPSWVPSLRGAVIHAMFVVEIQVEPGPKARTVLLRRRRHPYPRRSPCGPVSPASVTVPSRPVAWSVVRRPQSLPPLPPSRSSNYAFDHFTENQPRRRGHGGRDPPNVCTQFKGTRKVLSSPILPTRPSPPPVPVLR